MNELNTLFAHYTFQELIVIIIGLLLVGQGIWRLIDFYYEKYQIQIGKKINKEEWEKNLANSVDSMDKKIDELFAQNKETHARQDKTEQTLSVLQERMQENTRSFLIDAHHKFCYQLKRIDDLNLQSIERRYLYYKTAGGDTFIDQLMVDIRALPRIGVYQLDQQNDGAEEWLEN